MNKCIKCGKLFESQENGDSGRLLLCDNCSKQPKQEINSPVIIANSFCSQCGNNLNPNDSFCPKCGKKIEFQLLQIPSSPSINSRPRNTNINNSQDEVSGPIIAIAMVLITIICIVVYKVKKNSDEVAANSPKKDIVYNDDYDASVRQIKEYLNATLRDPSSVEYVNWSKVKHEGSDYYVRCKFRAKNGFNGYNIENKVFFIDSTGKVFYTTDFDKGSN
jgi:uncharacterized membrane protein YvbJ